MKLDNHFLQLAKNKLQLYPAEKQRIVLDLIDAIGTYFKKDLSDQIELWAADLIDLDIKELSTVIFEFTSKDTKGFLPTPSVIRQTCLNMQARRLYFEESEKRKEKESKSGNRLNEKEVIRIISMLLSGKTTEIQLPNFINYNCKNCCDSGVVKTWLNPVGYDKQYSYLFKCDCVSGRNISYNWPSWDSKTMKRRELIGHEVKDSGIVFADNDIYEDGADGTYYPIE